MILQPFEPGGFTVGGLDLSSTTDVSSWAMVQRSTDGGYNVNWRFYIPEARAARAEKTDGVPYIRWSEEGYITLTSGNRIDYATIEGDIVRDTDEFRISTVGFDPWNADYLVQNLQATGLEMFSVRQGFAQLSGPSKQLEAAVAAGTLHHGGNPIAEWMAENVEVITDANGNIRPVKPSHNSPKRIDGIAAMVNAIAVLIAEEPVGEFSWYDDHEVEVL